MEDFSKPMDFRNDTNGTLISYPRSATIAALVCAILFIIVGVIGNLITFIALIKCPKLRQHATTTFVLSLCVSDLLFCSVNLPMTASRYHHQEWIFGYCLCQLFPVIFYGNVAVSVLSMVAITLNRYVLIAYYNLYSTIYSKVSICIQLIIVWGLAFALMLPPLIGVWGQLGLDPETFSCTILDKDGHSPKKFFFLFGFALPCVVIVISYTCIYWKVRRSKNNVKAHSEISIKDTGKSLRDREDSRLTRLMLIIFICFLVCFLPLMIMNVADDDVRFPTLHVVASILTWASSVLNPFIYAASNRQYQMAYRQLFNSIFRRSSRTNYGSKTGYHATNCSAQSHAERKLQNTDDEAANSK